MSKRKYSFFHVATSYVAECFGNYKDALKFYGQSEKPSMLYGVIDNDGLCGDEYVCILHK